MNTTTTTKTTTTTTTTAITRPDLRRVAIEHNNQGARWLKAGNLVKAIGTIAKGLDMMKTILEDPPSLTESRTTSEDEFDILVTEDLNLAFLETSCTISMGEHQQTSYMFCSPVEIRTESLQLPLKISLMMVFNLALAHHINGIHLSNCDQLEKAIRLYECVYRISHEEGVELSVLHAMALTNNLGHVHLLLNDTQKSQKCFEQLLATLIYFVEVSDGNVKEMKKLKGFFSNATSLSMSQVSAPAA